MRKRTVALVTLVAALAVAPAIALGGAASNSQTYPDSTGEDPAGVDVSSVVVSNDDAGLISFRVNVTNRPALTADMMFQLYIDTAPNAGDPESFGADYVLQLLPAGVALFKWDAASSNYPFAASQTGVAYAYAASGPTLRVAASALGKPETISFVVVAVSGITVNANGDPDYANSHGDLAPNFGLYTGYQVRTTLTLQVVRATTSPRPARAGGPFSAALALTRNDTGGPVATGAIACTARVGGASLPVRARRLANGVAACTWTLPRNGAGKVVRGTVTVTVEGTRVTRSFSARITA
jgi:hypothetical protein